jgi:hypothetical protein
VCPLLQLPVAIGGHWNLQLSHLHHPPPHIDRLQVKTNYFLTMPEQEVFNVHFYYWFFLSFQIDILGSIFDDIFCSFMKQSKFAYRSAFFGSQPNEYYTIKFNFKFSVFFAAETLKGILTNCR